MRIPSGGNWDGHDGARPCPAAQSLRPELIERVPVVTRPRRDVEIAGDDQRPLVRGGERCDAGQLGIAQPRAPRPERPVQVRAEYSDLRAVPVERHARGEHWAVRQRERFCRDDRPAREHHDAVRPRLVERMRIGMQVLAEPQRVLASELFQHDDVRLRLFEKAPDGSVVVIAKPGVERDQAESVGARLGMRRRHAHIADDGNRTEHGARDCRRAEQRRAQREQQDGDDQQRQRVLHAEVGEQIERPCIAAEDCREQRTPKSDEDGDRETPAKHEAGYIMAFAGMRQRWLAVRREA